MSGCVAKHIRFGVAQPGGGQRLLGFVRPVHDETGQPLVSGRSGETGKDIHFRITEDLGDISERAGAILMGKRELACSCHTPVLIGNWVRSGTGGPSPQGVLHSERVDFIGDWVRKAKIDHPGTRCHSANDKHAEDIRRRYADGVFHDDRAMLSTSALQLLGRASAVSTVALTSNRADAPSSRVIERVRRRIEVEAFSRAPGIEGHFCFGWTRTRQARSTEPPGERLSSLRGPKRRHSVCIFVMEPT